VMTFEFTSPDCRNFISDDETVFMVSSSVHAMMMLCMQEVLVNALLVPSIHRVTNPDFINQTITWPVSARA